MEFCSLPIDCLGLDFLMIIQNHDWKLIKKKLGNNPFISKIIIFLLNC
jgi:hypothetical protein